MVAAPEMFEPAGNRATRVDRIHKLGQLIGLGLMLGFAGLGTASAGPGRSVDPVIGVWTWRFAQPGHALATNGAVTFSRAGTMAWSGGAAGTWTHVGATVTLTWTKGSSAGSVDTMTLAANQASMAGHNNTGWSVVATKAVDPVIGVWTWRYAQPGQALATHGTVTFSLAGAMAWSGGAAGTWTHVGATITLTWTRGSSAGSVDTMTLSTSQASMTGHNNTGRSVAGIKR